MNEKQKLVAVQYRVPADVKAWLAAQAAAQERSINWTVIKVFTDAMKASQKKQGSAK